MPLNWPLFLGREIGHERLARLVHTVEARFGADGDWQDFESNIRSAADRAIVAAPAPPPAEEQEYVEAMKADLRRLVKAEDAFFEDHGSYAATLGEAGLDFTFTAGNTPPRFTLTADGWGAVIGNVNTDTTCAIFVGSTPVAPATKPGEPACTSPRSS